MTSSSLSSPELDPANPVMLSTSSIISLLAGFTLMSTIAGFMLLATVWAGFGLPFNSLLSTLALLLPLVLSLRATHWLRQQPLWPWPPSQQTCWVIGSSIGLGVIALILFFSWFWAHWIDTSWDSLYYHKEAMVQLAWGWNPFVNLFPPRDFFPLSSPIKILDYISHASHAIELAGAVIYSWTHQVESAKAVNTLILLSSGCFAYVASDSLLSSLNHQPWLKRLCVGVITFVLACNPVSISQISILYNDGVVTNLLITLVLCGLLIIRFGPKPWQGLCLFPTLIVAAAAKLTGVFFSGLFILIGLLWLWRWRQMILWRGMAGIALCYIISIGFISINPFITDLDDWLPSPTPEVIPAPIPKQPTPKPVQIPNPIKQVPTTQSKLPSLYQRIMSDQSSPVFLKQPSIIKFIQSLNASPNVNAVRIPPLRNPFRVSSVNWDDCRYPDVRLGGFGPLFAITFWLSLLALPWLYRQRQHPLVQAVWVCLGALIVGITVFPESWWMRFVGFFSMWPSLIVIALLAVPYRYKHYPVSGLLCTLLLTVLILNNVGVGVIRLNADGYYSRTVQQEIRAIQHMHLPYGLLANLGMFGSFRFLTYENRIPLHAVLSVCPSSDLITQPLVIKGELFHLRQFPFFYNQVCYLEGLPKQP